MDLRDVDVQLAYGRKIFTQSLYWQLKLRLAYWACSHGAIFAGSCWFKLVLRMGERHVAHCLE